MSLTICGSCGGELTDEPHACPAQYSRCPNCGEPDDSTAYHICSAVSPSSIGQYRLVPYEASLPLDEARFRLLENEVDELKEDVDDLEYQLEGVLKGLGKLAKKIRDLENDS